MLSTSGHDAFTYYIATILVILPAIGFHEYAHAKLADLAGDPTPRQQGRVTLNLFKHLDPLGTFMIIVTSLTGFGIGWGRPVMVDPCKMHNPRWDHFWSVAAGPISNLLQAAAYALIWRVLLHSGSFQDSHFLTTVIFLGVMINLALCFFNLIPIGPLDGHWLVGAFLKDKQRLAWYRWNAMAGGFFLIAFILMGQVDPSMNFLGRILEPFVSKTAMFLLGVRSLP